jgi:hypothetical protein
MCSADVLGDGQRRGGRLRLELVQLGAAGDADPGDAVRPCTLGDGVQPLPLVGVQGEHLANLVVGQASLGAELLEQPDAAAAERRLQRAGLVVEARVDHARAAAGLVRSEPVLLLEEGDLRVGADVEQPVGHGRADDASAGDGVTGDQANRSSVGTASARGRRWRDERWAAGVPVRVVHMRVPDPATGDARSLDALVAVVEPEHVPHEVEGPSGRLDEGRPGRGRLRRDDACNGRVPLPGPGIRIDVALHVTLVAEHVRAEPHLELA